MSDPNENTAPANEQPLSPEEKLELAYQHVTDVIASEDHPAENPPPGTGVPHASVEDLQQQIVAMKDQLLRATAESENVRRRAQRDVEDASRYAVSSFARDLVSVVENLYRAVENMPRETADPALKGLGEGIDMTLRDFTAVLSRNGVQRISPQGEPFDHNFHQAVVQIDSAEHPAGTILQVMQAGYVLHDRLIQPAMVGVSRAPATAASPESVRIDTQA